jgi:lysophospholipid acyltransferase (LPLAT)-like uncharacterized protein
VKIRDPKTLRRVAALAAVVARGLVRSLSVAYRPLTAYLVNDRPELLGGARHIYATWHEYVLIPTALYSRADTAWLIGQHADGEIAAQVSRKLGASVVRGSSTRGGTAALLRILRLPNASLHLGITVDGPKGPRRRFKLGAVYLASRLGLPIVPVGIGFGRCWRARSWDRSAVPLPFSRVRCVSLHPVRVPPGLGAEELEPYRRQAEAVQDHATAVAEHWAETGEFDALGYEPPPGVEIRPEHLKVWPAASLVRRRWLPAPRSSC